MSLFGQKYNTLRDLYIHELKDLYSAETQITKALPKMKESANSAQLKQAFETHLRETRNLAPRSPATLARRRKAWSPKAANGSARTPSRP